jgi:hypothetical protein
MNYPPIDFTISNSITPPLSDDIYSVQLQTFRYPTHFSVGHFATLTPIHSGVTQSAHILLGYHYLTHNFIGTMQPYLLFGNYASLSFFIRELCIPFFLSFGYYATPFRIAELCIPLLFHWVLCNLFFIRELCIPPLFPSGTILYSSSAIMHPSPCHLGTTRPYRYFAECYFFIYLLIVYWK